MKEELIKFETAKLAKEKGFLLHTIDVFYQYDGTKSLCHRNSKRALQVQDMDRPECYVPTQSLLQKWLREEHDIKLNLETTNRVNSGYICRVLYPPKEWSLMSDKYRTFTPSKGNIEYKSYEQALEKGLQEALKLIKNK